MRVKSYLRRALTIEKRIKLKQEELQKWKSIGENISPKIKNVVNSNIRISDKVGESVINVINIQNVLGEEIAELTKIYNDIKTIINTLDDEAEKLLLEYRYLQGKSWKEIEALMGYSERHIQHLHGKVLFELEKIAVNLRK